MKIVGPNNQIIRADDWFFENQHTCHFSLSPPTLSRFSFLLDFDQISKFPIYQHMSGVIGQRSEKGDGLAYCADKGTIWPSDTNIEH